MQEAREDRCCQEEATVKPPFPQEVHKLDFSPNLLDSPTMADDAARRRLTQHRRPEREHWIEAAKVPFRDDSLMLGPPSLTAADFKMPRLRRCRFDLATVSWEARIGGGLDGYVWKVKFGDEGPFIPKVVSTCKLKRGQHVLTIIFSSGTRNRLVLTLTMAPDENARTLPSSR